MIIRTIMVMVIRMIMTTSAHINTVGTGALCIISSDSIKVEVIKVNQIRKNQIPAVQNPTL